MPNHSNLSGKVIALTGAASGIGLATAKLLAGEGAKLSLADWQEGALKKVAEELGQQYGSDNIIYSVVDVRNREDCAKWIQKTVQTLGKLNGAANLAGVIGKQINTATIEEIDDDDWDWVIGINLKGVLNCLREQIPYLEPGASVVNAASTASLMGFAKNAAYVSAKHAVLGLTRCAAKELGPKNIRVNCICP
jgi:NAD(P)-dependent dehydrogenase (short-subunit alcohol dehydrogenase family)